jgi:hypothetical protein
MMQGSVMASKQRVHRDLNPLSLPTLTGKRLDGLYLGHELSDVVYVEEHRLAWLEPVGEDLAFTRLLGSSDTPVMNDVVAKAAQVPEHRQLERFG